MGPRITRALLLASLFASLGCGEDVSGVYSGEGTGFLEKIEFRGDQRVELSFMGMTKEGSYEVEDGKVRINNGGDISILQIDGDCLIGGGILGSYCKQGADPDEDADASASLAGSRYAWGPPDQQMVLEFVSDDRVRMTMEGENQELDYELDGDEVTIQGVEGRELVFTRRGDELEGGMEGARISLQRQGR